MRWRRRRRRRPPRPFARARPSFGCPSARPSSASPAFPLDWAVAAEEQIVEGEERGEPGNRDGERGSRAAAVEPFLSFVRSFIRRSERERLLFHRCAPSLSPRSLEGENNSRKVDGSNHSVSHSKTCSAKDSRGQNSSPVVGGEKERLGYSIDG